MTRIGAIGLGLAVLFVLLWALYASRPEPAPPPAPPPQALQDTPPAPEPPLAAARPALPAPPAEAAAPGATQVPLEKLLRWDERPPAARRLDLAGSDPNDASGTNTAAGSGLGKRVYLQHRTDDVGPGNRERKLETTDVGVRMPVASSVELRGGMRVESRQDGDAEAAKTDPTPTVGVGVSF